MKKKKKKMPSRHSNSFSHISKTKKMKENQNADTKLVRRNNKDIIVYLEYCKFQGRVM